jgi:hypothetical protein
LWELRQPQVGHSGSHSIQHKHCFNNRTSELLPLVNTPVAMEFDTNMKLVDVPWIMRLYRSRSAAHWRSSCRLLPLQSRPGAWLRRGTKSRLTGGSPGFQKGFTRWEACTAGAQPTAVAMTWQSLPKGHRGRRAGLARFKTGFNPKPSRGSFIPFRIAVVNDDGSRFLLSGMGLSPSCLQYGLDHDSDVMQTTTSFTNAIRTKTSERTGSASMA